MNIICVCDRNLQNNFSGLWFRANYFLHSLQKTKESLVSVYSLFSLSLGDDDIFDTTAE